MASTDAFWQHHYKGADLASLTGVWRELVLCSQYQPYQMVPVGLKCPSQPFPSCGPASSKNKMTAWAQALKTWQV